LREVATGAGFRVSGMSKKFHIFIADRMLQGTPGQKLEADRMRQRLDKLERQLTKVPLARGAEELRNVFLAKIRALGVEVRRALDQGAFTEARFRMSVVNKLADRFMHLARHFHPDLVLGARVREGGKQGAKTRRKTDTPEILAYIQAGHSYGQAARKFKYSRSAIAKRVQRARSQ